MNSKFVPRIDKPCPKSWNDLQGEGACRYCDQCQHQVHNLSAMAHAERQRLLSGRSGRVCIAYEEQWSQVPVAADSWLWLQHCLRPLRWISTSIAAVISITLSSCSTPYTLSASPPPQTPDCVEKAQQLEPRILSPKMTIGVIAPPVPLWRRILFFWERY
jgi:hypothetical protein